MKDEVMRVVWTEYMQYRAALRGFNLADIEHSVRYSEERYVDRVTGSLIVVGRHANIHVMVAYAVEDDMFIPVTVHATTCAQINARLKSGRFTHE